MRNSCGVVSQEDRRRRHRRRLLLRLGLVPIQADLARARPPTLPRTQRPGRPAAPSPRWGQARLGIPSASPVCLPIIGGGGGVAPGFMMSLGGAHDRRSS